MKKLFASALILLGSIGIAGAQSSDFIPGANIIFEDNFSRDPIGDFPAKWSTNSEGSVVELDGFNGKWLKIKGNVSVNPELKKKLPEDCTIEFDLVITKESCRALFGLTPISDVSAGNIYYKKIAVTLQNMVGYPDIVISKDVMDVGTKGDVKMDGYIGREMHVSIAINKTRFRVYIDETKIVDMPKLLVPEYRNNFFIAGGESIPAPAEGIFISNVRIAAGEADARRLLIKQLYAEGSVVTNDIGFNPQTNEMTQQSYPVLETIGQEMVANPDLNIQLNGMEQNNMMQGSSPVNNELVQQKVEKMKAYLINKFHLKVDRIVTGINTKLKAKADAAQASKTGQKVKGFITEIVKL
jgi:OmpA-OmpF porin, OOP family